MRKLSLIFALAAVVLCAPGCKLFNSSKSETVNYTRPTKKKANHIYATGFDGFVNVRSAPSFKATIVGVFNNGPKGAKMLEDKGDWKKVDANGVIGYVPANYIQFEPTDEYRGNISKEWIHGVWENPMGDLLFLYDNGTFVHIDMEGARSYGRFVMVGNSEVTFMTAWTNERGYDKTFKMDQVKNKVGNFTKKPASGKLASAFKSCHPNYNKVFTQMKNNNTSNLFEFSSARNLVSPSSTNW